LLVTRTTDDRHVALHVTVIAVPHPGPVSISGFRERLTGSLLTVERTGLVTVPERGPGCGDGLLAATRAVFEGDAWVHPRAGRQLELRRLEVDVPEPSVAGFRAVVTGGSVSGIGVRSLPVGVGFADLSTRDDGHRLYYRLAVPDADSWYLIEGVKELHRTGARRAWWEATMLFTRVGLLDASDASRLTAAPPAERLALLAGRFAAVLPLAVGALRVREMLRRVARGPRQR
jgi:hypothetical protein